MVTGEDIAIRADDDAAAGAALHLALAVPGPLGVDHLLRGDDHDAGADGLGHLCGGHAAGNSRAFGGALRVCRRAVGPPHLLDDDLVIAAEACAHKAAHKAHGCGQHQSDDALYSLACILLRLLRRGRGCVLRACGGRRCAAGRLGTLAEGRSSVCGVHAAGTHIGVAGITGRIIGRGIVIFPFVFIHCDYFLSKGLEVVFITVAHRLSGLFARILRYFPLQSA